MNAQTSILIDENISELLHEFEETKMNQQVKYPSLYQINTRVWLTELSKNLGRPATLDDIPDTELDRIAGMGFDWIWFLSIWTTGEKGRKISIENPKWQYNFQQTLPDLKEEDIGGSGFAIAGYLVHSNLGGDDALKRLRARLNKRGLKLMLDFVPNHMGPDHPWVQEHPEYFVSGTEEILKDKPQNYTRVNLSEGEKILAYGRDPYFDGWPDTLQVDYSNPETAAAMKQELVRISGQCDGIRCDMAMLILPEIFEKTWGRKSPLFWPVASKTVREQLPDFCFMAEVYRDLESTLQQQGFDYTYDKRLYDRLREGNVKPIREHFTAGIDYQNKLARFIENHDEPRAADTFGADKYQAAAVITFLAPGLRFFHQGQFEGRKKRLSPHLIRAPHEPANEVLLTFYANLLAILRQPVFRNGEWHLLECVPAWKENGSWDAFVAYSWQGAASEKVIVVVNYSPQSAQCYLKLSFTDLPGAVWRLQDRMSDAVYDRNGDDMQSKGLYLDMLPWGYHIFTISALTNESF